MIEPMAHVVVVTKRADQEALLDWLYRAGSLHLAPFTPESSDGSAPSPIAHLVPDNSAVAHAAAKAAQLANVSQFCRRHTRVLPTLLDQFFPLKLSAGRADLVAAAEVDPEAAATETARLARDIEDARKRVEQARKTAAARRRYFFMGTSAAELRNLSRLAFRLISVRRGSEGRFLDDARIGATVAAVPLHDEERLRYFGLVADIRDAESLGDVIDDYGLADIDLAEMRAGDDEGAGDAEREVADAEAAATIAERAAADWADAHGRTMALAATQWESEQARLRQQADMASGAYVFAARGYVRAAEVQPLRERLAQRFPEASLLESEGPEKESPPTSLVWNDFARPASVLVKMYGMPSYRGMDPTPWVAAFFFCFVGICVGDVVYGAFMILIMEWLKRRYRDQRGLRNFFQLFVYCGATAMIFGVLTGGFMGDLLLYLARAFPVLEPLERLRLETLTMIDPIANADIALALAVGIGILTQFYALFLRTLLLARRGEWLAAFSDGALWIVFLAGLIAFGLSRIGGLPETWGPAAICVTAAAMLGLVLTQVRKGPIPLRIVLGALSLYGIVGSYGLSSFLGDALSYARLMALMLTSVALGGTFNMLADLAAGLGPVGVALAALLALGGHLLNFFLAIMSAFVHSARLVMLEMFGRAFEGGGHAFKPHGYAHSKIEMRDESNGASGAAPPERL